MCASIFRHFAGSAPQESLTADYLTLNGWVGTLRASRQREFTTGARKHNVEHLQHYRERGLPPEKQLGHKRARWGELHDQRRLPAQRERDSDGQRGRRRFIANG